MASTPEAGSKVVLVGIGDDAGADERRARRIVLADLPDNLASRAAHPSNGATRN